MVSPLHETQCKSCCHGKGRAQEHKWRSRASYLIRKSTFSPFSATGIQARLCFQRLIIEVIRWTSAEPRSLSRVQEINVVRPVSLLCGLPPCEYPISGCSAVSSGASSCRSPSPSLMSCWHPHQISVKLLSVDLQYIYKVRKSSRCHWVLS